MRKRIPYKDASGFVVGWLRQPGYEGVSMAGWDDDDELVSAFSQRFGLSTNDREWDLIVVRLRRLLKKMWLDSILERWSQSNHDRYVPQDPKWQYRYKVSLSYRGPGRLETKLPGGE